MNNIPTKSTVISSLLWKLMERGGTQGIQFLVQIMLARLLTPQQFGTIAIVTVFTSLASVFVEGGLNTALIQKKEVDEIEFSSVFYLSLGISTFIYILIFFFSPFIASFYDDPILVPILRVLSLTLFFGAFNSIQNAYIARHMMFKKLFISSLGATLVSGTLGIITAYLGYGVWALVVQQLTNQITIALILFFVVDWRPKLVFSISRVEKLFSFGWKLLASNLLNILYLNLRTLIIGRIYAPSVLGYYNGGEQFPKTIVSNINGSMQSVMLPTMSAYQTNKNYVKNVVRRTIVTSSFLIFPMMFGMVVIANPLIEIVLTEKWIPAVPFLQIFALSYSLMPIHTANLQAINALGRSDIFLRLEVVKKIIGIIILFSSIPFGVYYIAIGMLLSNIISSFINAYPNKKLLNYGYTEQLKDIFPSLFLSVMMAIIVNLFNYSSLTPWTLLTIQIVVGAVLYFSFAKIFRLESLEYLIEILRQSSKLKKNKK